MDDHPIQIFCHVASGKSLVLAVKPSDRIQALKRQIEDKDGLPPDQQRITFGDRHLKDDETVASCGIERDATLRVAFRLRGGGGEASRPVTDPLEDFGKFMSSVTAEGANSSGNKEDRVALKTPRHTSRENSPVASKSEIAKLKKEVATLKAQLSAASADSSRNGAKHGPAAEQLSELQQAQAGRAANDLLATALRKEIERLVDMRLADLRDADGPIPFLVVKENTSLALEHPLDNQGVSTKSARPNPTLDPAPLQPESALSTAPSAASPVPPAPQNREQQNSLPGSTCKDIGTEGTLGASVAPAPPVSARAASTPQEHEEQLPVAAPTCKDSCPGDTKSVPVMTAPSVSMQLLAQENALDQGTCIDGTCAIAPPALQRTPSRKVFDLLDTNGDGVLSRAEIGAKLSEFGLTDGDKVDLFNLLDTNNDGVIDRDEFDAAFEKFQILERGEKDQLRVWIKPKTGGVEILKTSRIQACCNNGPIPLTKAGLLPDEPPRLVFVGCTGAGKSSLCSALTGQDKAASTFKVGKQAKSETTECKAEEHKWLGGDAEDSFVCIDTPGLNDSEGDDEQHIKGIIDIMKKLEYVTCIVFVLNGAEPRFSKSLQDVITKFEEAFCSQRGTLHENFYDNLIVCFQRWKLNDDAVAERADEGISEESVAHDFRHQFQQKFPHCRNTSRQIPCIFVDSHDRNPERKRESLNKIKAALPSDVFRTGDLEQIVPRLVEFHGAEQEMMKERQIVPMRPQLADDRIKVKQWHVEPRLPPGLSISSSGVITGAPTCAGDATFTVTAESIGGKSAAFEMKFEVLYSESEIQEVVEDYLAKCSARLAAAGVEAEVPTDAASLDAVLAKLEQTVTECVAEAKNDLHAKMGNSRQVEEIISKVSLAAREAKTSTGFNIQGKYMSFSSAQQDAKLELEKADHRVQRLLLNFHTDEMSFRELTKTTSYLATLNPPEGSEEADTLAKAQERLEQIKPLPCQHASCSHVGPACKMNEHLDACLFSMKLMPHSAVLEEARDNCDEGFELQATGDEHAEYAGTYKPGPCPMLDDDEEGWFHIVDTPSECITRIKQVDGHWVLSSKYVQGNSWSGPGEEKEILRGSDSKKVDGASFSGISLVPLPKLSFADKWEPGTLVQDSVKLLYFGGMWCPYCPPFTAKLKVLYDVVKEEHGENALQVIFVSSDRSEESMLEYFGKHHGDWFALPYSERGIKSLLNDTHNVQGIPSAHIIDNSGAGVKYFYDEEDGGELSIGTAIRKLPDNKDAAKVAALELFSILKSKSFPCPSSGLVGEDYFAIKKAVGEAREHDGSHANMMGDLKDLQTGKFQEAAYGLKYKMGLSDDWKEEEHCTEAGILAEVRRLIDCAACAMRQTEVLQELGRAEEAQDSRRLADALAALKEAEAQQKGPDALAGAKRAVDQIRQEIDAKGGWYYGCKEVAPAGVEWPRKAVAHPVNPNGFSQPMCTSCKQFRLDHTTISRNLHYVLYDSSSEEQCFNGVRDRGRKGQKLQNFRDAAEAKEARLSQAEIASLRFYTSHSFDAINEALRAPDLSIPHPLPALTMCVQNAIKKLRAVGANSETATGERILWRGFRDMQITDKFNKDGGTEQAPMSTTGNPEVAVGYAVRKGGTSHALLFRIKTENNLQRGASLKWVSMFPDEDETLFPPLTFMQPTGNTQTLLIDGVTIHVVEVHTTLG